MRQKLKPASINTLFYLWTGPTIMVFLLLILNFYLITLLNLNFNPIKFPTNLVSIISLAIYIYFYLEYKSKKYFLDDKNVFFVQGVYNKKSTTIPLNKVNNISINQTLAQQLFKVCTVKFEQEDAEEYFYNISLDIAEQIRQKTQEHASKTIVQV